MNAYWYKIPSCVMAAWALAFVVPAASGQCPFAWRPGDSVAGTSGPVMATTTYNGKLIAGGTFTAAGSIIASYIAQWDGTNWEPLGSGVESSVYALTVYDGKLIVAGSFFFAGGVSARGVAQWDGQTGSRWATGWMVR